MTMRFEIKYVDDITVAQFGGFIDAMDYLLGQTKYPPDSLHLEPLPGITMPDNIDKIMQNAFQQ